MSEENGRKGTGIMKFTDDEWRLMVLYNPNTNRKGMIEAIKDIQSQLTGRDRNLKKWTKALLFKLEQMSDESFAKLDLYPDL